MPKKKIKIALVAPYPAQFVLDENKIKPKYRDRVGHPASWVRSLTTALSKRDDVEFRVFTYSRAVSRVQHGEDEGGGLFTVIPRYEPGRLRNYHFHLPARIQFRRHIREYAPDLVHGFGTESLYGLIATEQGLPNVVFVQGIMNELSAFGRGGFPLLQFSIAKVLEKHTVRKAVGLIAETQFAARWAKSVRPAISAVVIPHAVNREFLDVSPEYAVPEVLTIGNIFPWKAVDTSIRALAKAKNKVATLSVIGYGPLLGEMERLSAELGVGDRVQFLGYMSRDQIMEKMARARLLTILSRMDSSPNILTEAHAAGLPVIGSRAGGIPYMIDEGKDGFLVDVDDAEAVAERIDRLIDNPDLCRKMGQAGREKVKWLNDPDRVADLHVQVYREISGQARMA